jgi:hypothetical protein
VGRISYDGLGRRIVKAVGADDPNADVMGDWAATHHYYHNGRNMIETRNAASQVLKQQVWGLTYVDELVQVGLNQDPSNASTGTTENNCERFFWACQDANFNVVGLVSASGDLVERYEYTPYGRRTVFTHGWARGDFNGDGLINGTDYQPV